jgi:hypothetical protein
MDRIIAEFPDAIVREPQQDPLVDFETIRQSKNVVVGVSTYSWLAAWLSDSADNIYLTVNGLFNPMQASNVDLLPYGDARYKFFLFPINYAVPLDCHAQVHRRIAPYWRQVSQEALRQQLAGCPRFERSLEQALAVFDEAAYLQMNPDVARSQRPWALGLPERIMPITGFMSGACRCASTARGTRANTHWLRSRSRRVITLSSRITI